MNSHSIGYHIGQALAASGPLIVLGVVAFFIARALYKAAKNAVVTNKTKSWLLLAGATVLAAYTVFCIYSLIAAWTTWFLGIFGTIAIVGYLGYKLYKTDADYFKLMINKK